MSAKLVVNARESLPPRRMTCTSWGTPRTTMMVTCSFSSIHLAPIPAG